jgi:hypothetical protein
MLKKEFVPSLQRKILFSMVLLFPPAGIGYMGVDIAIHRPHDFVIGMIFIAIGIAAFLFWFSMIFERIVISENSVKRTNLLGTIELPLKDILTAKLEIVGRGNTALIVRANGKKYRIGMAFPDRTIHEMADLITNEKQRLN